MSYFRNAVSNPVVAKQTFTNTQHPGTVFIQMFAPNPGFSVGDMVTYVHPSGVKFSGKVWYIYKTSTVYNLYIKHPNPSSIGKLPGGTVYPYGQAPSVSSPTLDPATPPATQPPTGGALTPSSSGTGSAADGLHTQEDNETITTPSGHTIGGATVGTTATPDVEPDPVVEASLLPAGMDLKKIGIFAAIGIAGLWLLKKLKK